MITGRDIGERFIRSVQIIEKLYSTGPRRSGSAWVEVPYTQADKNGWGSERLAAERKAFWNSINRAPKPWEISEAEETQTWLQYVPSEDERLCLVSWARCMALGKFFKDWCKQQGIHPETGRRRKERAILRILLAKQSKPLQHNENIALSLLPETPDLGHKCSIIGEVDETHWRAETAKPLACYFDTDLSGLDWSDLQNQRRRERDAKRRSQAA